MQPFRQKSFRNNQWHFLSDFFRSYADQRHLPRVKEVRLQKTLKRDVGGVFSKKIRSMDKRSDLRGSGKAVEKKQYFTLN